MGGPGVSWTQAERSSRIKMVGTSTGLAAKNNQQWREITLN